jgi:hypothetical protein
MKIQSFRFPLNTQRHETAVVTIHNSDNYFSQFEQQQQQQQQQQKRETMMMMIHNQNQNRLLLVLAAFAAVLPAASFAPTIGGKLQRTRPIAAASPPNLNLVSSPMTALKMNMFGGMFGGSKTEATDNNAAEALAIYKNLQGTTTVDNIDVKVNSLSNYLSTWAQLFENGTIHLTTPAKVSTGPTGVRLDFKKVDTGYQNKSEEEERGQGGTGETKKKKGPAKQGGVEILVETVDDSLQVRARRCNTDEDTLIKEMSEETILQELKKAMEIWKKEQ